MSSFLFRARGLYDNQWCEGDLARQSGQICTLFDADGATHMCKADTLGLFTGRKDRDGHRVFSGQRVRSVQRQGGVFAVRFGEHKAWHTLEFNWAPTVGFYCEDAAGGHFPLGEMEKWAVLLDE